MQSEEVKARLAKASEAQVRAILAALEVPDAVLMALLDREEHKTVPEPAPAKPRSSVQASLRRGI
jgi:hypothetical protein